MDSLTINYPHAPPGHSSRAEVRRTRGSQRQQLVFANSSSKHIYLQCTLHSTSPQEEIFPPTNHVPRPLLNDHHHHLTLYTVEVSITHIPSHHQKRTKPSQKNLTEPYLSSLADPLPIPNFNHHTHLSPPQPSSPCACYTHTTTISNTACPPFAPTPPCIYPLCLMLTYVLPVFFTCLFYLDLECEKVLIDKYSTSTIPGPNAHCPTTTTATALLPCETACRRGCGTSTRTETAAGGCLDGGSKTVETESWFTGIVTIQ